MNKSVCGLEELPTAVLGPGIYFLLLEGTVVYVGQAACIAQRIGDHVRRRKIDDSYRFNKVSFFSCRKEDLNDLERYFINKFVPEHNHNGGPTVLPLALRGLVNSGPVQKLVAKIEETGIDAAKARKRKDYFDEGLASYDEEEAYSYIR